TIPSRAPPIPPHRRPPARLLFVPTNSHRSLHRTALQSRPHQLKIPSMPRRFLSFPSLMKMDRVKHREREERKRRS
ncbi:hypothetical protein PMAYCL1PPCAC_23047, partial [Pristionchus mayeri]